MVLCIDCTVVMMIMHSKNTEVKFDPEWVHYYWRQTPFRVNGDPQIGQLDVELYPELGQTTSL